MCSIFQKSFLIKYPAYLPSSQILSIGHLTKKGFSSKTKTGPDNGSKKFVQFEEAIENRRQQAARSVVVQVHSEQSCPELYDYCKSLAPVKSLFHYELPSKNHFVLVEFEDDCLKDVSKKFSHLDKSQCVPVVSPFLWFRGKHKSQNKTFSCDIPLQQSSRLPDTATIKEWLNQGQPLADQMRLIYESTKLDELGTRLRFLTGRQIETSLSGMFPNCKTLPFGSTVNGFGKANCDLDLVLLYDDGKANSDSRLVFHSKSTSVNGRLQVQRQMEILADQIQQFLPGCCAVKRILQARVPIIKFTQELTGVDCDLSLTNLTAVYMSEMLWLFGELSPTVRELVFTIKIWANTVGLTDSLPGRWITNFSLTLLTIFYLQNEKILPAFDTLIKQARGEDVRFAEDINCTFLRDITELKTTEGDSPTLLKGFFEFYSQFDFSTCGISICSGKSVVKPDYSPLYIVNPLERSLNVSKNMSPEETERLKIELRNAIWTLDNSPSLAKLFRPSHVGGKAREFFYQPRIRHNRLVAVKDLFQG